MKEIRPMWRMVRLLKKSGYVWVMQKNKRDIVKKAEEDGMEERIKSNLPIENAENVYNKFVMNNLDLKVTMSEDGKLRTRRITLVEAYLRNYYPKLSGSDNFGKEERILKKIEIQEIINSCMEYKKLAPYKGDENILYLTKEGEDFTDRMGLAKAYARSLGPFWSVIIGICIPLLIYLGKIIIQAHLLTP